MNTSRSTYNIVFGKVLLVNTRIDRDYNERTLNDHQQNNNIIQTKA